jgi:hypothetical protein
MKVFERFSGRARGGAAPDPGSPHAFRPMNDPGMGAAAAGSGGTISGQALAMDAVVTGNLVREQRCGVPGCNRMPDDPIHFPGG